MTEATMHAQRAQQLATEQASKVCEDKTRQGDLMICRIGDVPPDIVTKPTPHGGYVLSAGRHGEHRLIGEAYCPEPGVVDVDKVIVVHTDVPDARHDSVQLTPGRWRYYSTRELSPQDASEQEVAD